MSMIVMKPKMFLHVYVDGSLSGYWKCVPVCMSENNTSKRIREMIWQQIFSTGRLRKCSDGLGDQYRSQVLNFRPGWKIDVFRWIWMGCVWFLFFLLIINKLSVL